MPNWHGVRSSRSERPALYRGDAGSTPVGRTQPGSSASSVWSVGPAASPVSSTGSSPGSAGSPRYARAHVAKHVPIAEQLGLGHGPAQQVGGRGVDQARAEDLGQWHGRFWVQVTGLVSLDPSNWPSTTSTSLLTMAVPARTTYSRPDPSGRRLPPVEQLVVDQVDLVVQDMVQRGASTALLNLSYWWGKNAGPAERRK